jgi:hypothetical protein
MVGDEVSGFTRHARLLVETVNIWTPFGDSATWGEVAKPKAINLPAISPCATAGIVAGIQESPAFVGAQTLRDQCWFSCRLFQENHTPTVPHSFIRNIPGINKATVKSHHKRYETLAPIAGRHGRCPLAAEECHRELVQRMVEADQRSIPWKIGEMLAFGWEKSHEFVDKIR